MNDELEVFLESTDVAREGEVSVKTVRLDAEAGRLPVVALTRRGVRLFRESDVRDWAAKRDSQAGVLEPRPRRGNSLGRTE